MIRLHALQEKNPILASQSPRRKQLLSALGLTFDCISENVEESYPNSLNPKEVPVFLAQKKLGSLPQKHPQRLIISADTVVLLDQEILGKPQNHQEAISMLSRISGKKHQVITGVGLAWNHQIIHFSACTDVYFRALNIKEVEHYVNTFSPLDKAGSYGVQEWIGLVGIEKINGCYYNVMGLPLSQMIQFLTTNNWC